MIGIEGIVATVPRSCECQYKYVETAVSKCLGRVDEQTRQMVRYIENIDFEPPRNPKKQI